MSRWLCSMTVLLIATTLTMGCAPPGTNSPISASGAQRAGPQKAKRIVAAMMGEPASFVARMTTTQNSIPGATNLEQLVNASLSEEIGDHSLQPLLSDAVPSLENGLWTLLPDGRMETTWIIREGARWHDGTPFTSEDLVFTTTVDQNRDVPVIRPAGYSWVERVDAVDARTVRVTWSQPFTGASQMFTARFGSPLPKHILAEALATDVSRFPSHPHWVQEFVGTGPFAVRQWVPGASIQLVANGAYVLGRPKIDEIEIRFIVDLNTLMVNLISGTVDLSLGRGFTVEAALQLRDQWRDGKMDLAYASWVSAMPQFMNPSPPVIGQAEFRRALLYGVERQQLVDSLQGGFGGVAHVYISPQYVEHRQVEDSVTKYAYDPRRAVQMIEGLGYSKGADGVYRDGSGERLAVELRSNGAPIGEQTIVVVADLWSRLGIVAEPVIVPQSRMVEREYVATFPGFRFVRQPDDPDAISRYHSSQTPTPENRFVGPNYSRYVNPSFDALIDRYFSTVPRDERMQVLRQIVRHMTEAATVMGMFYDTDITFMHGRLQGVGARQSAIWDVHLWDFSG